MRRSSISDGSTPERIAATALQEHADVIGISYHSWEFPGYTGELLELLRSAGDEIPVVLGGEVITAADAAELKADGVTAVIGPGVSAEEIRSRSAALWTLTAKATEVGRVPSG